MSFTNSSSYQKLIKLAASFKPQRDKDFQEFTVKTDHIYFDYSRQLITSEIMQSLFELAQEQKLPEKIKAMFNGDKINKTEDRSVLHVALRSGKNPEVESVLDKIKNFSNNVLSGKQTGVTGKKIKNIVSIGIGGSYLGPAYLATAPRGHATHR